MSYLENAQEQAGLIIAQADFIEALVEALAKRVSALEQAAPPVDAPEPPVDVPEEPPVEEPEPPVDEGPGETPPVEQPPVVTPPVTPPSGAVTVSTRTELDAALVAAKASVAPSVILLAAGDYGSLRIDNYQPQYRVTLQAATKHAAHFDRIEITSRARSVQILGVHVCPATVVQYKGPIVTMNGADCYFEESLVWPSPDIQNHTQWTAADWMARLHEGIHMTGAHCVLRKNSLLGCGLSSQGDHCEVDQNTVMSFPQDALRCTGNYNTFTRNVARGCIKVNGNHDDGLQIWSTDGKGGRPGTGAMKGLVYVGNEIHERLSPLVQNALYGPLQGVGAFDGTYEDATIMGNQIEVTAGHGIALWFALNSAVELNVVKDAAGTTKSPPKISIRYNQDGPQPYSQHLRLHNNVAPGIFPVASTVLVSVSGNMTPNASISTVSDLIRHHHGDAKADAWDDFKAGLIDLPNYLAA